MLCPGNFVYILKNNIWIIPSHNLHDFWMLNYYSRRNIFVFSLFQQTSKYCRTKFYLNVSKYEFKIIKCHHFLRIRIDWANWIKFKQRRSKSWSQIHWKKLLGPKRYIFKTGRLIRERIWKIEVNWNRE